jgi:hypothetical protein
MILTDLQMADGSHNNRSATEILREVEALLSPEAARSVRATVAADLQARRARLQAEAEQIARELDELAAAPSRVSTSGAGPGLTPPTPSADASPAVPAQPREPSVGKSASAFFKLAAPAVLHLPPPDSSARTLVLYFARRKPGAKAAEFVAFAEQLRPGLDAKNIHHELYAQSKPGGALVKRGERPNSQYYPSEHPEEKP